MVFYCVLSNHGKHGFFIFTFTFISSQCWFFFCCFCIFDVICSYTSMKTNHAEFNSSESKHMYKCINSWCSVAMPSMNKLHYTMENSYKRLKNGTLIVLKIQHEIIALLLTLSTRHRRLYNVLTFHKDCTERRCAMSKLRQQPGKWVWECITNTYY